jgi:hypothetical protein
MYGCAKSDRPDCVVPPAVVVIPGVVGLGVAMFKPQAGKCLSALVLAAMFLWFRAFLTLSIIA